MCVRRWIGFLKVHFGTLKVELSVSDTMNRIRFRGLYSEWKHCDEGKSLIGRKTNEDNRLLRYSHSDFIQSEQKEVAEVGIKRR